MLGKVAWVRVGRSHDPPETGQDLGGGLVRKVPLNSHPGALSYLNYKGLWSLKTLSRDRRLSFFRWASVQKNLRRKSQMQGTVQSRSMLPLHSSITL